MAVLIDNITKQGNRQTDLFSWEFQEKRTIRLTGEISDALADEIIAKLEYLDSCSHQPIRMVINSPGGSVTSGLAVLDAMRRTQSPVHTVCTGLAASMAAVLAACGGSRGERCITPHAEMMIHQPLGGISGQASDVQVMALQLTKTKDLLIALLAEATGKTREQISTDIDRNYWLDAKAAVAYGLADRIA